jgi:hypothetical protein
LQKQLRKIAVTRDELEAFLDQATPRRPPSGLKRQVLGNNLPLIPIGGLFFIAGLVAGIAILLNAKGLELLIGVVILVMPTIIGACMAGLTIWHRRRKKRLLRDGIIADGNIVKVSRACDATGGPMEHRVTVKYSLAGRQHTATCTVHSLAMEEARRSQAAADPVRVLVDPRDEKHVLCADLITQFN